MRRGDRLKKKTMLALLFSSFHFATVVSASEIGLEVSGIERAEGLLQVALYAESGKNGFPNDGVPLKLVSVPVGEKGGLRVSLKDLERGKYAIAVFHDVNGNGQLDKNFLGIPTEPFGFSNDPTIFLGAPGFERCAFSVANEKTELKIRLKRF
jgi:uncharacterized protein (DUF2141 family)